MGGADPREGVGGSRGYYEGGNTGEVRREVIDEGRDLKKLGRYVCRGSVYSSGAFTLNFFVQLPSPNRILPTHASCFSTVCFLKRAQAPAPLPQNARKEARGPRGMARKRREHVYCLIVVSGPRRPRRARRGVEDAPSANSLLVPPLPVAYKRAAGSLYTTIMH